MAGLVITVMLELLVVIGFVAWLGATDRLSRERLDAAVEIFRLTQAEEERLAEEAAAEAERQAAIDAEEARLASAAAGLQTLDDRLRTRSTSEDVVAEATRRMRSEREAIERRLATSEQVIKRLRDELEAERTTFEEFVENQRQQRLDQDFQQAVTFYEQMQPKQAKASFQQLVAAGEMDQVIDYLSEMQLRKSGAVLREFKAPEEVAMATQLLARLRERGLDPTGGSRLADGDTP
ncbi:MAG: hypothetical protein AAF078_00380 [Planctomycetota bacterium]